MLCERMRVLQAACGMIRTVSKQRNVWLGLILNIMVGASNLVLSMPVHCYIGTFACVQHDQN